MYQSILKTPIGLLQIGGDETGIHTIRFVDAVADMSPPQNETTECAAVQLSEYFRGTRKTFDVPLAPKGTEFQQSVWATLQTIPYGASATYLQIAQRLHKPLGVRTVGSANGCNPIATLFHAIG
ncbi:MAG: methylated-DNA--[protein]-cysteine S-methyltransferase [Edaphocola sp.]